MPIGDYSDQFLSANNTQIANSSSKVGLQVRTSIILYNIQRIFMNAQKSATQAPETALCQQCHAFYGTQNTDWLCSACYKKGKKQIKVEVASEVPKIQKIQPTIQKEEAPKEEKPEELQKDKKRCFTCQKKVGLLGIECKCKFIFCNSHRMPEDHKCEFNFKEKGIKELQKTIVKVEHGKIEQI